MMASVMINIFATQCSIEHATNAPIIHIMAKNLPAKLLSLVAVQIDIQTNTLQKIPLINSS